MWRDAFAVRFSPKSADHEFLLLPAAASFGRHPLNEFVNQRILWKRFPEVPMQALQS